MYYEASIGYTVLNKSHLKETTRATGPYGTRKKFPRAFKKVFQYQSSVARITRKKGFLNFL